MTINRERTFVFPLIHEIRDLANHPDDAEHMVGMAVRDEHVVAAAIVKTRKLELAQDGVAAARVREQEAAVLVLDEKTGVVAMGDHRTARAEHREFPHRIVSCHFFCLASAIRAACCSASFLLEPSPSPQVLPLMTTA